MSSPILPTKRLTLEEFLEFEMASPLRYEFVDGEVYALAGVSKRHHRVLGNIHIRLATAARGGPCEVFVEGVKLRVGNDIYYPDLIVACSESDTDDHVVREPCLLIEITSPSTARIDRTNKLHAYRGISSLRTYLIVEQGWRRVVRHWRDTNNEWQQEDLHGDATIMLPCPDVALTLDQIYEGLAPLTVKEMETIGYSVEHG